MTLKQAVSSEFAYRWFHLFFFIVELVIIALDFSITIITMYNASISIFQLGDGVSIRGLMTGIIVVEIFLFILHIVYFIVLFRKRLHNIFAYTLGSILFLTKEAILYKFIICFNYPDNGMVIARSSLVFLITLIFVLAYFFHIFYMEQRNGNNPFSLKPNWLEILLTLFVGVLQIAIVILNIVLLASLKQPLGIKIGPSNIQLGYFNQNEINSIQSGVYLKDMSFNDRFVGNLSEIIYSKDRRYAYRRCTYSYKSGTTCTYYYWHFYKYEIECNDKAKTFYKDCATPQAKSLQINAIYLDDGPYPQYNCLVNTFNTSCASNCTQLVNSNYDLIMIQQNNERVEPAWKGFCNCATNLPRVRLPRNSEINFCRSFAHKLNPHLLLVLFSLFLYILN
jgi:hypothetical protein